MRQRFPALILALFVVPATAMSVEEGEMECSVSEVVTGDTMRVQCAEGELKLRLYCIDAPEIGQHPWDEQSRTHLQGLAGETVVVHEFVIPRSDQRVRRERVIAEVFRDGVSLNLEMVTAGQAAIHPRWCKEQRFLDAEAIARVEARGIWSEIGLQQTPWEFRSE